MKGLQYLLGVMMLFLVDGAEQFHEGLSEDHLTHYFGAKTKHEVPDYEITSPTDVTSQSTSSSGPQYTIKAFNNSYHIVLQRNEHLIAPGCLVLARQANGTSDISPCHQGERYCYYHGHVVNQTNSAVAVSTCTGVHGMIKMLDHDLVIQPIKQEHAHRVRRSGHAGIPHLVYRRRRTSSSTCGSSETPFQPVTARRTKRTAGGAHYMEIRVVMAPDATKYHGTDARRYALTSLNIAAQTFMDPTLGHEIRTAVVQILLLQDDQPGLSMVDNSEQLLNNFCFWHEKRQPSSESDDRYADGALLITKLDLKYQGDTSNLGLGHIGGICKANYRCSVNEDNGLDLGLTIAHETGHMLNMGHDGDNDACTPGVNIMSGKGASGHFSTKWSTCSRDTLTKFLSSPESSCLSDQPPAWAFSQLNVAQKPGLVYSGDEQCRLAMEDTNSKLCEGTSLTTGNECKMLVCYGPIIPNRQRSCYRGGPTRLDGTECGNRKWCIGGRCVNMGAGAPTPVHGGWSSWSVDWTPCSRTCGGGVRVKTRKCNEPEPRFGGRDCAGESSLAKMCNMKSCPTNTDFRAEQCAATNRYPLDGKTYNWLPYNDNLCTMRCYDSYANIVDYRADSYKDGTECKIAGTFSRCISGHCKKFGCDGHLNSGRLFDKCGVCGGQGNTCATHRGTYNQGHVKAYVTVVSIPRGATRVVVTNGNSYCHMSVKIQGSLLFSQGTSISLSGKYTSRGVIVEYRRSGPEKITISGPTPVALEIQVWREYGDGYVGSKPDISYTYSTPTMTPYSGYIWKATQGPCSRTCGTGHSLVSVQCMRVSSNTRVEDFHCDIYKRPQETLLNCNTKDCPPQWQSEDWSSCSKTCGGGAQSRVVHCVIIQGDSYRVAGDNHCNVAHKPSATQQCSTQPCPGFWKSGAWSTCSRTCGRGTETRDVDCYASEQSNSVVAASRCPGQEKPIASKHCMLKPCNTNILGEDCRNKVDCTRYADNICEDQGYRSWVRINCIEFCGICAKDPTVYLCKDKLTNCDTYEVGFCQKYKAWSESNCQRTCGFCGGNVTDIRTTSEPCVDKVYCAAYQKDACTNGAYRGWAQEHCRKFCGLCGTVTSPPTTQPTTTEALGQAATTCVNLVDCGSYGADICTNSRYRKWANHNCQKHCGWCSTVGVTSPPTTQPTTTEALGQTATNCVNLVDCASYGADICTNSRYRKWANHNCQKHCGWCSTAGVSMTSTNPVASVSSSCRDLLDCTSYLSDICTSSRYSHWAHINCPDHCGWCYHTHTSPKTTPVTTTAVTTTDKPVQGSMACVDTVDCAAYQSNICTAPAYQGWAHINCRNHCGWCGTSAGANAHAVTTTAKPNAASGNSASCSNKVDCSSYQGDICTNSAYKSWAKTNCPKFCNVCGSGGSQTSSSSSSSSSGCVDKLADCSSYQADICSNPSYTTWAKENCAKHCDLCEDCTDKVSCNEYQGDICNNQDYKNWASTNCAAFCNMCGSRRRRSVSSLLETLDNLEPSLKVAQMEPRYPVPRLSPAQEPKFVEHPEPRQLASAQVPNYVIKDSEVISEIYPDDLVPTPVKEVADLVPTPVKEVADLFPTQVKQVDLPPKSENDINEGLWLNEQLPNIMIPDPAVSAINSRISSETNVQDPSKESNKSDLPNVEEGQAPLVVPAPKINLDLQPPQQNIEVSVLKSTDAGINQEIGSKGEGQQGVKDAVQETEAESRDGKLLVDELDALKGAM
ncbi:A disintegrin and metalloproteinase with thrombospondin motifs 6-like isoform X2 [Pecten maximus]|uniref:A disintegrin and metalloproteinase with thrombospondin motifs 6-like isoform X2 n=1 Tax=Pecten maximus TaxID=6579 RepID=UPI001458F3AC|nr:A disintegrin and metalloproteinase with thrombospondin motifs 6-like isoform X2 [Pecten maximus]